MIRWLIDLVVLVVICATVGGLVQIRTSCDRQMERDRGIIRYGPRVSLEEAERLWDYLNEHHAFTGETVVVRIGRSTDVTEITFVVVPEFVDNAFLRESLTVFSQTLCGELYPDQPVRVIIANDRLQSLGTLIEAGH